MSRRKGDDMEVTSAPVAEVATTTEAPKGVPVVAEGGSVLYGVRIYAPGDSLANVPAELLARLAEAGRVAWVSETTQPEISG